MHTTPIGKFFASDCHPPTPLDPSIIPDEVIPEPPDPHLPPFHPFPSLFSFELAYFMHVEARLSDAQALALNNLLMAQMPDRASEILSPTQSRKLIMESSFALLGNKVTFKDEHGREYTFYFRDLLACVRTIVSLPHLATQLSMEPEVHLRSTPSGLERVFSDIKTGDAWAEALKLLPIGHVLVPLVLSSDKSVVFNRRSLWPIYLSCAMHSSEARASPSTGAAVLVGYLVQPAEEHIDVSIMSDASHINKEVFHKALRHLFFGKSDFIDACTSGTPMRFPNGNYYMAHPHLLLYIADLPELALVGLTKQNRACPICPTKAESFVMRCQHVQAREMTDVKDLYGVAHSGMVTKAAVEKQEMDDGIHLSVWVCANHLLVSLVSVNSDGRF
ncbi:hypothetical protein BCR44DRAFT_339152 [Catenaria anguillulae PL171]|uniref:Uncharacterized protein n=1 Tax=Catenaria anguillulae PL171 TaxID=765915 RepID=A0A1Y2I5L9_9FUNG|nr:hypothetical protein BCR44DRAFT_339152 [Catenaria anguillulae PL171]